MALPYTSGLDRPQETLIAEALVRRIGQLGRDRGMFLRCVAESPAVPSRISDSKAWDQMLDQMRGQAPAALVVVDGARPVARGMTSQRELWQREFDVVVAVFSNHRRDTIDGRLNPDVASRAADTADPGIRATCELIDTLLLGWPLDVPTAYEVEPASQGIQTVVAGNALTLREMHYRVRADRHREPWPDVETFLAAVRTTYDLPGAPGVLTAETEVS